MPDFGQMSLPSKKLGRLLSFILLFSIVVFILLDLHSSVSRQMIKKVDTGNLENKSRENQNEFNEIVLSTVPQIQDTSQNLCSNPADLTKWTFSCKVDCPVWNITDKTESSRRFLHLQCVQHLGYSQEVTSRITNISVITFKHPCLRNIIMKKCEKLKAVPKIVHYIWLGYKSREFEFQNFLSVLSAYKFIKPCMIFFHGETLPYGHYWDHLLKIVPNIVHIYRNAPESLDPLRDYNFTLSKAFDYNLSNGLIMSVPHAKFANIWYKEYKSYDPKQWGTHSTILPYKLSKIYPNLIHVEEKTFVKPNGGELDMLFKENFDWSKNYAIHLFIRFYRDHIYDINVIRNLNTTMGSVARYTLFDSKELCLD
ncbi:hypothetical protein KUTeg_014396 [Tegillarca granosa]|uniref:Uncharacterized protein n=1 Tax=Tegillarca granosa TaxID=220873 RepID=A0ABQ9F0W3_TEGGR|nr:hypothetical protein KUTeg_014396 [Tegillarca granosa]